MLSTATDVLAQLQKLQAMVEAGDDGAAVGVDVSDIVGGIKTILGLPILTDAAPAAL